MTTRIPVGLALCVLFAIIPTCYAQDNPNIQQGLSPYESFHGGDIDKVDLGTGNLWVHIPLASFGQRGKLALNFSLQSNNKGWVPVFNGSTTVWSPQATPSVQPIDDDLWWFIIGSNGNNCAFFQSLFSPNGGVVPIDFTSGGPAPEGRVHGCGAASPMTLESTDSSALMYTGPNTPTNVGSLVDRHGTRYGPIGFREDVNGNEITLTGGSNRVYTDSLGRQIPMPPGQLPPNGGVGLDINGNPTVLDTQNPTTTNYNGCTGTQSIVFAILWNVPAPGGGTATYKLCYAKISLSTNFRSTSVVEYNGAQLFLQSVVLPNGTAWTFDYSSRDPGDPQTVNYGDLTKITLPTGGTIAYSYANVNHGSVSSGGAGGCLSRS